MHNLIIDIGNTLSKIAVFQKQEILFSDHTEKLSKVFFEKVFSDFPHIENAIFSSVGRYPDEILEYLKNKLDQFLILDHTTSLPFNNQYKSSETLGKDRIAAVAGANNIFPGNSVLVIDMGTAITYDFINKKSQYKGGNISPGLNLRFKALHHFTNNLPWCKPVEKPALIGQFTEEAITSGVQNGILFEIEAYIEKADQLYRDLKVIATGGDLKYFVKMLKNSIFAEPFLVLKGLNRILDYNIQQKN